ncbi:Endonuclease, Uma2 family [Nostoc flagelliforme CCNUN1]|uniref:Endonuclease, Uma2 family n=1 Tax=Nostoc flagelliforme CCNUN1 TaxID=2038116 RepID=A0A2K8STE1_9NOSO|nr:Endonuclease, Uma2 family [Nostoc flagelliforme CCNUN1]
MSVTPNLATPKDVIFPPGDLYSDEPPLETDLHRLQMTLLIQCLKWLWRNRNDFYVSGNLTIYYTPRLRKSKNFRGPDFFVVLGTERKPRKSWVVWEEDGKYPKGTPKNKNNRLKLLTVDCEQWDIFLFGSP